MSINNVVLVGRLTKDVELKYTPAGAAVATFTLAVNRTFTNGNGDREADFINIVVWRKAAENAANFLHKGNLAGVVGRIQTRNYDNDAGNRVYVTEVIAESVQFLEPKKDNGQQNSGSGQRNRGNGNNNQQNGAQSNQNNWGNNGKKFELNDDDLPF